jgi:competence protein ComEA
MRQWLEGRRDVVAAIASTSLVSAIVLGAVIFRLRQPQPAPIVILPITPASTQVPLPTATPGLIKVYVSGAVLRPGVYALPWDSRVENLVAAAGGATDEADLLYVNLAQRVFDEQQIHVPRKGDLATPVLPTPARPTPSAQPAAPATRLVNINTASASELETLPGIGPTLAQRIIDYRQANGPFRKLEDIVKVKGIGEHTFDGLRNLITIE